MAHTTFPTDWNGKAIGPARAVGFVPLAPGSEVPTGSIPAVLEWVGYDPVRARQAITAEYAKPVPDQRKSLITKLERALNTEGATSHG